MTREAANNNTCRTVVTPRPRRNKLLLRLLLNETVPGCGQPFEESLLMFA